MGAIAKKAVWYFDTAVLASRLVKLELACDCPLSNSGLGEGGLEESFKLLQVHLAI